MENQEKKTSVTIDSVFDAIQEWVGDQGNRLAKGYEKWKERNGSFLKQNHGDCKREFRSEEVFHDILDVFICEIELEQLKIDYKCLDEELDFCNQKLRKDIANNENYFVNDKEEKIIPERGGVYGKSKEQKRREKMELMQFCQSLVENDLEERNEDGLFLESLETGYQRFIKDIKEFICEYGEEGKGYVNKIFTDREFAKNLRKNENVPVALSYLAELCIEMGKPDFGTTEKKQPIGFATGK
jgi:hypothetical protein